jgi:hypothetical protein
VTPQEVQDRYGRQETERLPLYNNRQRFKFAPPTTRTDNSALQVRSITPRQLNSDDGDVYYLVGTTVSSGPTATA